MPIDTPLDLRPFTIAIPEAQLDDLHERLARTRLPQQIPDAAWDYGTEFGYLSELVAYSRDEYDWRRAEARLNAFDKYLTEIDGARVHFLHVRSPEADTLPLVITHGWPGSVVEFLDVLGPLSDPAAHGGDPADASTSSRRRSPATRSPVRRTTAAGTRCASRGRGRS